MARVNTKLHTLCSDFIANSQNSIFSAQNKACSFYWTVEFVILTKHVVIAAIELGYLTSRTTYTHQKVRRLQRRDPF